MNGEEISEFERLHAQLQSLYAEIGTLSRKKPDDAVNEFELKLINQVLERANTILGEENQPFDDFLRFDPDNIPTNSDAVLILSQYLNCLEILRADNVERRIGMWYWLVDGKISNIRTAPPRKLKYSAGAPNTGWRVMEAVVC